MKYLFTLIILATLLTANHAQDYHFSQLNTSPLYLNPALTGNMELSHRLNFKYREQWNSVLNERDYKTMFFSYDNQICLLGNSEFFSYGVSALVDRAGTHQFTTTLANVNLGYRRKISGGTYIGVGVQAGTLSYSLGNRKFKFDEQFGPYGFDFNAESFEDFRTYETGAMFDMGVGLHLYNDRYNFQVGLAAFHINRPTYSFFEISPKNSPKVNTRFVLHGSFMVAGGVSVHPVIMVQQFVPKILYWQFVPTIKWSKKFWQKKSKFTLSLGARITKDAPTQRPMIDAGILGVEINFKELILGFSYDANVSSLAQVSHFRSGSELSVIYFLGGAPACGLPCFRDWTKNPYN